MILQGDPFKTLFVARVSYEATERKLRRDFEEYGPVKSVRLVHEKNNGNHCFPSIACQVPVCSAGSVNS